MFFFISILKEFPGPNFSKKKFAFKWTKSFFKSFVVLWKIIIIAHISNKVKFPHKEKNFRFIPTNWASCFNTKKRTFHYTNACPSFAQVWEERCVTIFFFKNILLVYKKARVKKISFVALGFTSQRFPLNDLFMSTLRMLELFQCSWFSRTSMYELFRSLWVWILRWMCSCKCLLIESMWSFRFQQVIRFV
jgi:hypothetical protein